jgi:hypothetical protein
MKMHLGLGLRGRAAVKREETALAVRSMRDRLYGLGLDMPVGINNSLNFRMLPSAERSARLTLDLDLSAQFFRAGEVRSASAKSVPSTVG